MKKLIPLLLIASGCTTVTFQAPANRFISPESQSDTLFHGRVHIGGHGGHEVEVVQNRFSSTPTTIPEISEDSGFQLGVELQLINRLDAYYIANSESYNSLGIKFQAIGPSAITATEKSWSLALGGGFLGSTAESDTESGTDGAVTSESETTIDFSGYEFFVLAGYRPTKDILLYFGPWFTKFKTDITLDNTESGVTTRTVDIEGEGDQKSILIGAILGGGNFKFNLEGAFTRMNYKRTTAPELAADEVSDFVWGGVGSFSW
jgi:hypothetical protein